MEWLKDKRRRVVLCLVVAGILAAGVPEAVGRKGTLAWWGTIYPEFCFAKEEKEGVRGERDQVEVKISFWLAKVLDW